MHLEAMPTRPEETDVPVCPTCSGPVFPREPGSRDTMARCAAGHWVPLQGLGADLVAAGVAPPDGLAGLARRESGVGP